MTLTTSSATRWSEPSPLKEPPRSLTTTFAPCSASISASPRPTPFPAPGWARPSAPKGPAEVVDDDLRAVLREHQRLAATDPVPGSGDDRDFAVEHAHLRVPSPTLETDVGVTLARRQTKPPSRMQRG